jgi:hypothetical protein
VEWIGGDGSGERAVGRRGTLVGLGLLTNKGVPLFEAKAKAGIRR